MKNYILALFRAQDNGLKHLLISSFAEVHLQWLCFMTRNSRLHLASHILIIIIILVRC